MPVQERGSRLEPTRLGLLCKFDRNDRDGHDPGDFMLITFLKVLHTMMMILVFLS